MTDQEIIDAMAGFGWTKYDSETAVFARTLFSPRGEPFVSRITMSLARSILESTSDSSERKSRLDEAVRKAFFKGGGDIETDGSNFHRRVS